MCVKEAGGVGSGHHERVEEDEGPSPVSGATTMQGRGVKGIPTYSMRPDQMYPEVSRNMGKSQNCTRWTQKKKDLLHHSVISGDPGEPL